MSIFVFFSVLEFLYCAVYIEAGTSLIYGHIQPFSFNYNTYKKKILLCGDRCLTGTCCFWNYSPIGKNVCVIFYIDFVRGTPFQKAKIIQKLSVTVYYQKRLSYLDTLIKITITKIISFQHQKYSFNIKLLKLI